MLNLLSLTFVLEFWEIAVDLGDAHVFGESDLLGFCHLSFPP
jgi:hypothetical protein